MTSSEPPTSHPQPHGNESEVTGRVIIEFGRRDGQRALPVRTHLEGEIPFTDLTTALVMLLIKQALGQIQQQAMQEVQRQAKGLIVPGGPLPPGLDGKSRRH